MSSLKKKWIKLSAQKRLYHLEVPIIGLTGGLASGKSSVTQELLNRGHPVICADKMVKKVYQQNETYDFISEICPEACASRPQIKFEVLRQLAFSSPELLSQIEHFIYQRLPLVFKSETEALLKMSSRNYLVYDIPLLFEKALESSLDFVVLVYCPKQLQIQRAQKRDKSTLETIQKILTKQDSIEDKKEKSDFVIDNSKDKLNLINEIDRLEKYLFN